MHTLEDLGGLRCPCTRGKAREKAMLKNVWLVARALQVL